MATNRWKKWFRQGYGWVRNQDLFVLLSVLGIVIGLWVFFELADEVKEGGTRELDERVIRSMRSADNPEDAAGPVWLEEGVRDITALGSGAVLTLFVGAAAGFIAIRRQYHALGLLLIAIIGGVLLNVLLKDFFDRPRPELVPALHRVHSPSFPSGHSLLAAVVYLTLGALLARLVEPWRHRVYIVCVALLFTFLVGLSRVYLGVHYPTDVLAGWTLGLIWAVICWLVARRLQREGKVEKPSESSVEP